MPNERSRLTKITTRTGDGGKTKLATGRTVTKSSQVVRAMGSIDELNSLIGVLAANLPPSHLAQAKAVQQSLFDMGAVFAMEGQYTAPDLGAIESATQAMNETLPPLTEFVLPGGGVSASQAHVCRSVCRRAETDVWTYLETLGDAPASLTACAQYLNRLSDYFFVLARVLTETAEEQWSGPQNT